MAPKPAVLYPFTPHFFIEFQTLMKRKRKTSYSSTTTTSTIIARNDTSQISKMARTTLSLEQKLENAKNERDRILQKYNNDRSYMSGKSTEYRSTKDDNLKTIWSDYNKLCRAEKTIRDLEKILEEKDDDNDDDDNDNDNTNQQRAIEATSSYQQDQQQQETSTTIRTRSSSRKVWSKRFKSMGICYF